MAKNEPSTTNSARKNGPRIDAAAEWRSRLTGITSALLAFTTLSGLAIYLLPFSLFNQFNVISHTLVGILMLPIVAWFVARHWWVRRKGRFNHFQLLGYLALTFLVICILTGVVITWQALVGPRVEYVWDWIHLLTGLGLGIFLIVHLVTIGMRKLGTAQSARETLGARRLFYRYTFAGMALSVVVSAAWALVYQEPVLVKGFPTDYNWAFGEDRPFAPSLARLDNSSWREGFQKQVLRVIAPDQQASYRQAYRQVRAPGKGEFERTRKTLAALRLPAAETNRLEPIMATAAAEMKSAGSVDPRALAGSEGCGSSGCHEQIYKEWLPSAHRYSSLDDMFQQVQTLMVQETTPEHTRYCAGCHDPISLFTGAKNSGNITLSAEGANEGSSCLVCHSIVQADVQGNGDYTIEPQRRYAYELDPDPFAKRVSDFLIRSYPQHHISAYSRPLYKTPEFCAACHKQYLDKEVNTDIGKVQGQNQYDSWKNSRWYHEGQPEKTVACRECHMQLVTSDDPARGDATDYNRSPDDQKHRSHRTLASNQYIPALHKLEGNERHLALTRKWLRGEVEIPEIADKWTSGPVVRMEVIAPPAVSPGEDVVLQVLLTNNKTGHDFPTGPLDMIESWIELSVFDETGERVFHTGGLDETGRVAETPVSFRADGFDREGKLIDRHNLWDLVGASYKRSLYPGMTDTVEVRFQCPSLARGRLLSENDRTGSGHREQAFGFKVPESQAGGKLRVKAVLWYRKANPDFLDRVYGTDKPVRSPRTRMTEIETTIDLVPDQHVSAL